MALAGDGQEGSVTAIRVPIPASELNQNLDEERRRCEGGWATKVQDLNRTRCLKSPWSINKVSSAEVVRHSMYF